jgi:hypothetical protein
MSRIQVLGGIIPVGYDNIVLDPPAKPTTITYKKGSDVVAVLTITYDGDDIATVSRA